MKREPWVYNSILKAYTYQRFKVGNGILRLSQKQVFFFPCVLVESTERHLLQALHLISHVHVHTSGHTGTPGVNFHKNLDLLHQQKLCYVYNR